MKIIITGISGYLGFELAKALPKYEIIGIDINEPKKGFPNNVIFYKESILNPHISDIFSLHKPEVCIHLAWVVSPIHNKNKAYNIDCNGTKNIFSNCRQFHVRHIIFMSSTLAYGALKDNPELLTEEDPLRARSTFHYSYHKRLVELEIVHPFINENKNILVTILRPPGFLGPMANNYISSILKAKLLPVMIGGRFTKIQFIYIDDLLEVIELIVSKSIAGIFNVTPDNTILMKDLPNLLSGHKIYIPESIARFLIRIAWFFRLYKAPSSYLDFVRYEFNASNEKIKRELGWNPQYTTEQAIKSLLKNEKEKN